MSENRFIIYSPYRGFEHENYKSNIRVPSFLVANLFVSVPLRGFQRFAIGIELFDILVNGQIRSIPSLQAIAWQLS